MAGHAQRRIVVLGGTGGTLVANRLRRRLDDPEPQAGTAET